MEFSNRNVQSQAAAPGAPTSAAGVPSGHKNKSDNGKWGRVGFVTMVGAIVILLGGAILLASAGGKVAPENKYVDNGKLQAIFLNTGQVYFGNIKTLNSRYFVVKNIYYLQTANGGASGAAAANSSVSLVKLGCELHQPDDQMVINRDQVTFWENLHDSGQVAKAVTTFEKQNPNGQKCADQSSSASPTSTNSAQPAGTNTPATPAPETKPNPKP